MTEEQIALARRVVACPKWRWMPGMKLTAGLRLSESLVPFTFSVDLPDLTDPATLGCLLALVRDAWSDPHASVWYCSGYWHSGYRWSWWAKEQSRVDYGTEAEALVAALEAATDGR